MRHTLDHLLTESEKKLADNLATVLGASTHVTAPWAGPHRLAAEKFETLLMLVPEAVDRLTPLMQPFVPHIKSDVTRGHDDVRAYILEHQEELDALNRSLRSLGESLAKQAKKVETAAQAIMEIGQEPGKGNGYHSVRRPGGVDQLARS